MRNFIKIFLLNITVIVNLYGFEASSLTLCSGNTYKDKILLPLKPSLRNNINIRGKIDELQSDLIGLADTSFYFRRKYQFNAFSAGQTWLALPPVDDIYNTHVLFLAEAVFPEFASNPKFLFGTYIQTNKSIDIYMRIPIDFRDSNKKVSINGMGFLLKYNMLPTDRSAGAGLFEFCNNIKYTNNGISQKLNRLDIRFISSQNINTNNVIDFNIGISHYWGTENSNGTKVSGGIMVSNLAYQFSRIRALTLRLEATGVFRIDDQQKKDTDGVMGCSIDFRLNPSLLVTLRCSKEFGVSKLLTIFYPHQFSNTAIVLSCLTFLN